MANFGWSLPAGCGQLPGEMGESDEAAIDQLIDGVRQCLNEDEFERLENCCDALIEAFWASYKAGHGVEADVAAMADALGPVNDQVGLKEGLREVVLGWRSDIEANASADEAFEEGLNQADIDWAIERDLHAFDDEEVE